MHHECLKIALKLISPALIGMIASYSIAATSASETAAKPVSAPLPPELSTIKKSADAAQHACYEYMHDDAREYVSCLNALVDGVKGKGVAAQQQRLGIVYFAWVGANNSARLSLTGAEAAAQMYLPKFKSLQKQLRIADEALCLTIAGDCKERLAQIAQMEKDILLLKPVPKSNKPAK